MLRRHNSRLDRSSRRAPRKTALALLSAGLLVASVAAATVSAAPAVAAIGTAEVEGQAQTMQGFGASGAWWVNDLTNYSSSVQSQVGNLLFTSSGIDLSQYRYNIGGGGNGVTAGPRAPQSFLTSSGSYDWSNDPGGRAFLTMAADDGVPDLIGFVNSAPEQYTTNNENCGGEINTADDAAYGTYLATVVSHFKSEGIDIDQVSPMNEPDDSFSSCGQEGMEVPATERAGVINGVGAALSSAGLSTTVIADESSQTSQLLSEAPDWLADATAPSYVSAIAHHTYDDPGDPNLQQVSALGSVHGKQKWATEICCQVSVGTTSTSSGYGQQYDPTISGGLVMANIIYRDLTLADDSAFQWWTALSSELGCDPATDSTCATEENSDGWNDGLIYYDPDYATDGNQSLYTTKRFYVLGQYSKYVRPGAVRYAISGEPSGVQAMAFWRNNAWTVVATNMNTSATSFPLNLNSGTVTSTGAIQTDASENMASVSAPTISGSTMTASLPAQSVTTFTLSSTGQPGSGGYTANELVGTGSSLCLDVPGGSTTNGTYLETWSCNAGTNQEFTLTATGTITVYGSKCLDAYDAGTATGTRVDIYTCNGGSNQQWEPHPNGTITNAESGLCLDVYGASTSEGAEIDLYTCNGGTNQEWTL